MKILVSGNYKDGNSGWANACKEFILCLDKVATVVPRAYKLNQDEPNVPQRILELEQNDETGVDVVFHIGLPHNYKRPAQKSVSYLFVETDNFIQSGWARHLNYSSDLVLVPNDDAAEACVNSEVNVPVKKVYVPTDLSKYENLGKLPELKAATNGDFLFYFIGDFTVRKNLHSLLRAFHLEFTPNEPVSLVVKTSKYGASEEELRQNFRQMSKDVKSALKIRAAYKEEVLIVSPMTNKQILELHNTCDCLVNTSYGEAWGIPVIDAACIGKPTICNAVGGPRETSYIKVSNHKVPCFDREGFDFLNTGHENWGQIDIRELQEYMRWVYECRDTNLTAQHCQNIRAAVNQETIGRKLIDLFTA